VVVDKKRAKVICTNFANGRRHDFRVFKESKVRIQPEVEVLVDSGYTGIEKYHAWSKVPIKRRKKQPLTQGQKVWNRELSSRRALNENVIGKLKRFKVLSERYRNRRKRFGLRFNLIAGIYNFELELRAGLERGLLS